MKLHHTIWLLLFLVGCPAEPPTSRVDADVDAVDLSMTPDASRPDVGIRDADSVVLTVEVVPIEWGLFADGSSLEAPEVSLSQTDDGAWQAEGEIPAGIFALRVDVDGELIVDATNSTDVVGVNGEIAVSPFFNPAPTRLLLTIRYDGTSLTVVGGAQRSTGNEALDLVDQPTAIDAWFDDSMARYAGATDPGAVTVEILDAYRRHGGPVATPRGTLFLTAAQDGESAPQVRGTWNNFEPDPASELRRVREGLWARYIEIPSDQQYKIYYPSGDAWITDRGNPHIAWDGFDPGTVGAFNSVVAPSGARTVWLPAVESPQLSNARDVYVHLPAGYDSSADEYPALYVHDGNESIVRGQFHQVADAVAVGNATTSAVLVFVALAAQNERLQEYTMGTAGALGDAYVDFLVETLVPAIEAGFRVRTARTSRGVTGASLGGLISFWAAMQRPDIFGYSAGMSSSFFWGDEFVINEIAQRGCQDVTYYLDSGSPADNFEVTQTMRDTLTDLGCDFDYVLEPGGEHDWSYWKGRFDGVLEDFADVHGG